MPKIIIYDSISDDGLKILTQRSDIKIVEIGQNNDDLLYHHLIDSDAIILRYLEFNRGHISSAKQLKVIARHGVGYDNVDVTAASLAGIPVATIGSANSVTVAELTLYLMLSAAKQGISYDQAVRKGDWHQARKSAYTIELFNKNLFILGYGRIGKLVASRCQSFGMNILVYDPYIPQSTIEEAGFEAIAELADGLKRADIITLHTPLTKETKNLIDAKAFYQMKAGALLINTSRGPVVNEKDLNYVLKTGKLFAAGIDVYATEPPNRDDPLILSENSVFTPHIGGLTKECVRRSSIRCAQNALNGIEGLLEPEFIVNKDVLR